MNKPLVAALLVVNLLCGVVLGYKISYETCQGQLRDYEQRFADYESALGEAQVLYDAVRIEASEWMRGVQIENANLRDRVRILEATNEWYRWTLDLSRAEASRWKSLSNVLSGTAY